MALLICKTAQWSCQEKEQYITVNCLTMHSVCYIKIKLKKRHQQEYTQILGGNCYLINGL